MSEESIVVSAADLREIVCKGLSPTISLHRASVRSVDSNYEEPVGEPTDEEIDDFLFCNPLLDSGTVQHLTDEGLLGFFSNKATTTRVWIQEFRENVAAWANNNSWLSGDAPALHMERLFGLGETEIWTPLQERPPGWIDTSPSYLLLAADLLRRGQLLSEMNWRDFERLVGELLEGEGWSVQVTRASKDGGIDVIAERSDAVLGHIKTLWQAKKYGPSNKVKLNEVRELSAIRESDRATKAVIVTTSHLTHDAIEWVKRDQYRLGYHDKERVEAWIRLRTFGQ